jgi:hypothetical protein
MKRLSFLVLIVVMVLSAPPQRATAQTTRPVPQIERW